MEKKPSPEFLQPQSLSSLMVQECVDQMLSACLPTGPQ